MQALHVANAAQAEEGSMNTRFAAKKAWNSGLWRGSRAGYLGFEVGAGEGQLAAGVQMGAVSFGGR